VSRQKTGVGLKAWEVVGQSIARKMLWRSSRYEIYVRSREGCVGCQSLQMKVHTQRRVLCK
jgi:hypothetical protein